MRSRSAQYPTNRHRWLTIARELPPCRCDSVIKRSDRCPACARAGHYDTYSGYTELRYDALDAATPDLARTYEYWGEWRALPRGERIGGSQLTVQRVRRASLRIGVRRVSFEPLIVGG